MELFHTNGIKYEIKFLSVQSYTLSANTVSANLWMSENNKTKNLNLNHYLNPHISAHTCHRETVDYRVNEDGN